MKTLKDEWEDFRRSCLEGENFAETHLKELEITFFSGAVSAAAIMYNGGNLLPEIAKFKERLDGYENTSARSD